MIEVNDAREEGSVAFPPSADELVHQLMQFQARSVGFLGSNAAAGVRCSARSTATVVAAPRRITVWSVA